MPDSAEHVLGEIRQNRFTRARAVGGDVEISWQLGLLSIDRYNLNRSDGDKTGIDKTGLPGSYTAPVLNPVVPVTDGSYVDVGASPPPGTAYFYEVYGRDCSGGSLIP